MMQSTTTIRHVFLSILFVIASLHLFANDDCANAIALVPANTCTYTSASFAGSTLSGDAPSCASAASQDVWFSFVATEKTMGITISAVSGLNHGFEIIAGSCTGSSTACVNNSGFGNAENYLGNGFTIGQTYYIRVYNANTLPVSSSFNICVQQYSAPVNDNCLAAISLTPSATCQSISGSFSGSDMSSPAPTCFENALQYVWYKFIATDSTMSISLEATSGLNHGFELIGINCNGSVISCINNGPSGNSEFLLRQDFIIGQEYFIRVFNAGTSLSTYSFGICVKDYFAPTNDACTGAITLTPSSTCTNTPANLSGSGITGNIPECAPQASQDIWFKFVADNKIMSVNLSAAGGLNHGLEIYQNNCSGSIIACVNNNSSGIGEFYLNSNMTVGETYYIRVFNVNPAYNTGSFSICVQHYPTPGNDACSGAIILNPGIICENTAINFSGAGIESPLPGCGNEASQDIWYQFTASQTMMSVSLTAVTGLNHGFEILTGSCSGNVLACVNANASGTNETYLNNNFTIGQTYFIRVFNAGSSFNTSSFNICVQQFVPPTNNNCATAMTLIPRATCTNIVSGFSGASLSQAAPVCAANAAQDIWFRFKATDSTMNVLLSATTGLNHGFGIFKDGCSGTVLTCVNVNGSGAVELFGGKIFIPGEEYLIRVFNASPTLSLAGFNICVYGTIQPCIASIEVNANDSSVCEGTPVNFTASSSNGGVSPVYQWKVNGVDAGINSSTFTLEAPNDGDKVSCVLTSSDPCANQATVGSDTIMLAVESKLSPLFTLVGPFCEGTSFSLPTVSENEINGDWSPEINSEETSTYVFTPETGLCASTAQMTVIIDQKVLPTFAEISPVCRGIDFELPALSENDISGTWQPAPNDTLSTTYTFSPDQGQCASEGSLIVTIVSVDTSVTIESGALVSGAAEASYQWINCDDNFSLIDGENNQEFLIVASGNYAVIVNQSGCIDTSNCVQVSTVSIHQVQEETLLVFPNPAGDFCSLKSESSSPANDKYLVFDGTGKVLLAGSLSGRQAVIDLRTLPSGIYFVRLAHSLRPVKLIKI